MRTVVAAGSDIGHVREGNEDSYLVQPPLFAVADGMGGHRGGEVASSLALETLEAMFARREGTLVEQVREANRAVLEKSLLDRSVAGMGTTLTTALLEGDRLRLAHVGDSRAYLLREGELRLLTEDHTLVHRMVLEGELTPEEAEVHPHRSILTRALGTDVEVEIDELEVEVRVGDRVLLCTDGLTGMLSDGRVCEVLTEEQDGQAAVDRLIGEANEAGGVDNVTAIIIDLVEGVEEPDVVEGVGPDGAGEGPAAPRGAITSSAADSSSVVGTRRLGSRLPWKRALPWIAAVLAVVVVVVVSGRVYLDSQWYVGVSDGRVAIYRGIPASVAGFELHHVVVETTVEADAAAALALYRDLADGITADDFEEADAIVEQIRTDVAELQASPTP
jgi:protein phosphatase